MKMARSTYYQHLQNQPSPQETRDRELKAAIEKVRFTFPGYGHRKLYHHFLREGKRINRKRIRRVTRKYGLYPVVWKSFKIQTTQSDHNLPVFPNLLKGVRVTGLNQAWVADITYIAILSGFVYLAAILDLFSRKVIGWAISRRLDHEFTMVALRMAIQERKPPTGCIHHSDRGIQYACWDYVELLQGQGLMVSMSRTGNPYDNAFAESFFKTLKYEEVHLFNYETYEDVLERIPNFIEEVYNKKRLHSSIGYLPPEEFEKEVADKASNQIAVRPILCSE